ncbi:MAG TPA: hypothetical protein VF581_13230 [Flavobacterium sp.]|jgi:hypothetical protein
MFITDKIYCCIGIALSVVGFILGEVLLNTIAPIEALELTTTTRIILGCTLMTLSILAGYFLVKHLLYLDRTEKRRKNTSIVFLADQKEAASNK